MVDYTHGRKVWAERRVSEASGPVICRRRTTERVEWSRWSRIVGDGGQPIISPLAERSIMLPRVEAGLLNRRELERKGR